MKRSSSQLKALARTSLSGQWGLPIGASLLASLGSLIPSMIITGLLDPYSTCLLYTSLFGLRMAEITREASYIDVVERALYNTVLAGIALDGRSFFYVNPLEVWPDNCLDRTSKEHVKPIRQKWFGVACCPPNIARTLASLGQYIYGVGERELYLNLFVSNESLIDVGGHEVKVTCRSEEHTSELQSQR